MVDFYDELTSRLCDRLDAAGLTPPWMEWAPRSRWLLGVVVVFVFLAALPPLFDVPWFVRWYMYVNLVQALAFTVGSTIVNLRRPSTNGWIVVASHAANLLMCLWFLDDPWFAWWAMRVHFVVAAVKMVHRAHLAYPRSGIFL